MDVPETSYARTPDGVHIAYQVTGDGPVDLVYMAPWYSHVELRWRLRPYASFVRRLASFSRLLLFDRRGSGMSDPVPADRPPDLERRMDDALAVMDAAGSQRAVIYGASESGAMAALFAATYPDRTVALVIHGSYPRTAWAPDFPWGETLEEHQEWLTLIDEHWGTEAFIRKAYPQLAGPDLLREEVSYARHAMSPGAALAYERMAYEIDVRSALPAIHVPTLVLHRVEDLPEANQYFAEHIAGARLVRLPGREHVSYLGNQDEVTSEIERFVRGVQDEEARLDRVLATVLFTDIADSTAKAAELGDHEWRALVERHHATVRAMLARYRGTEVDTAGDGFFATFDGPARGVRCAQEIVHSVGRIGLQVRAGVHTGEVESSGGKVGGMAVVIGARVGAAAEPGQVLATSTVKELTAGSGLAFEDAGRRVLKGVPEPWQLFSVVMAPAAIS